LDFLPSTGKLPSFSVEVDYGGSMEISTHVLARFRAQFGAKPNVFWSPGRVNLIGEHTDYNGGWVLPAAIDKGIYLAIRPSNSEIGHWMAMDKEETIQIDTSPPINQKQALCTWANYLWGVVSQLQQRGFHVPVCNLVFAGDLPIGAGMSSSAALGSVFAFALNKMFDYGLEGKDLARLVQQSENEFVGIKCGIMDMFTSLHGKANHALQLDCQTLEFRDVPLALGEYRIVLFNTNVKHALVDSAYNERREQCEAGLHFFRQYFNADIPNLSAVPITWLQASQSRIDPIVYRRCQYVLEEHIRIQAACKALTENNLKTFGQCMTATHQGLRYLYEVSCAELDFLFEAVWGNPKVLGTRMMGGGFGGCTINLIHQDAIPSIYEKVARSYEAAFGPCPDLYEVITANGTEQIVGKE